jgi:uncharacterized phage infection (PIP) family protein YhgE
MSGKVAQAILEIVTDTGKMSAGLDAAVGQAKAFGTKIEATTKGVETAWKAMSAAMGVLALGAVGKEFLDMAGNVADLSARLNISTDTVQEWQATFGKAGIPIESVAKSSEILSEKINGGDKSAVAALQAMGLSVAELQAMNPDERFIKVADAVGQLQNQDDKIAASKGLFGKGGPEMLAALDGHLADTIDQIREMGLVIDGETIAAADDFGDQLGLMGTQLLGIVATVVGPLLPALSALGNVLSWIGRNVIEPVLNVAIKSALWLLYEFVEQTSKITLALAQAGAKLPVVGKYFEQYGGVIQSVQDAVRGLQDGLWKQKEATERAGAAVAVAARKVAGLGDAHDDAGKKAKKQADELERLKDKIGAIDAAIATGFGRDGDMGAGAVAADIARAKATVDAMQKALGVEQGMSGGGVWNIGVQLDLDDARNVLAALEEQTATSFGGALQSAIGTLPALLTQAFTGGGGLGGALKAFTSQIGGNIGRGLFEAGGALNGVGNKLAGIFGSAFGLALPGIGQALGALVGPALEKLYGGLKRLFGGPSQQELGGRAPVAELEKQYGGLEGTLNRIGDAYVAVGKTREQAQRDYKAMLDAEKQGAGAVQPWIDSFRKVIENADAAAKATTDAEQRASDQIAAERDARLQAARDEIDGLAKQRADLAAGLAQEAAEEDAGVIERQQRAQLEALDAQIQEKNDAYAQLAEQTGAAMKAAIEEALASIRAQPVHVPAILDAPGGLAMKDGADQVLAANAGAGDVVINLEGREIARGALPYLAQAANAYGVTG